MSSNNLSERHDDALKDISPPNHNLPPKLILSVQKALAKGASPAQVSGCLARKNYPKTIIEKVLEIAPLFRLEYPKIFHDTIISEAWCNNIISKIETFDSKPAKVYFQDIHNPGQEITTKGRVTEIVDVSSIKYEICEVVSQSLLNHCQDYFNVVFESFQCPQLLRYKSGGRYNAHSDSGYFGGQDGVWMKTVNRDISLLCYLDEDYQGGELYFVNFDLKIKPRKGSVIAFPSHFIYQHAVLPVTSGKRHVIASWSLVQGSNRVDSSMPAEWIKL